MVLSFKVLYRGWKNNVGKKGSLRFFGGKKDYGGRMMNFSTDFSVNTNKMHIFKLFFCMNESFFHICCIILFHKTAKSIFLNQIPQHPRHKLNHIFMWHYIKSITRGKNLQMSYITTCL